MPVVNKPRILVVEDQWMVGQDIASILRNVGIEVIGPVGTVDDALEALKTRNFDAGLLDINLHGVHSS